MKNDGCAGKTGDFHRIINKNEQRRKPVGNDQIVGMCRNANAHQTKPDGKEQRRFVVRLEQKNRSADEKKYNRDEQHHVAVGTAAKIGLREPIRRRAVVRRVALRAVAAARVGFRFREIFARELVPLTLNIRLRG